MTHTSTEQPEALQAIRALREYIEAIPKEIADGLPAMPGIDGEWLDATEQTLEESQARVPLSDEWIKELMGLVSRYGNLNYQECDADYREHQTKSERYAQDQRDTFSAIESKLRTIGITQEKQG